MGTTVWKGPRLALVWMQCLEGRTTGEDCNFLSGASDPDNYVCDDGACVYLGCHSTEECVESWGCVGARLLTDPVCRAF